MQTPLREQSQSVEQGTVVEVVGFVAALDATAAAAARSSSAEADLDMEEWAGDGGRRGRGWR